MSPVDTWFYRAAGQDLRTGRRTGPADNNRSGIGTELLDLEEGEGVDDGPEDPAGDAGIKASVGGDVADLLQHGLLAGAVDDLHAVGPLVADDLADELGPLGEDGDETPIDHVEVVLDGGQVQGRGVGHRTIML